MAAPLAIERKFGISLAVVLAAAAALRFHALDRFSYSLDEILQTYWMNGTWSFFWKAIRFDAGHPPLDYVIARVWEELKPADSIRKIPVVLYGISTIGVYAALIARRGGAVAGLVAGTLLAFAPFHVRYSQELRPYALAMLLLCLSLLCLDWYLERPDGRRLAVLFLVSLATVYTAYIPQILLGLAGLALLIDDGVGADSPRRANARRALLASPVFLLALWLAYLPWWPVQLEAASRRLPIPPPPPLSWDRIGRIFAFFSFAPDGSFPFRTPDAFFLALVLTGSLLALRRPGLRFLVVWAFAGLAVIEALWRLHPHWDVTRIYLPAGIALCSLAALPIAQLLQRGQRAFATALLAAVLLLDSRPLLIYFRQGRPDWRLIARFLAKRPSSEWVFTENASSALCVAFYVVGPHSLYREHKIGRPVRSLDGEALRLTYSWPAGTAAWLVLAGQPEHPDLRAWSKQFSSISFHGLEEAVLVRLDDSMRQEAFVGSRAPRR